MQFIMQKKLLTITWAFLSLIILSGCGSTPNNYLSKQITNKIGKTDVYITIPQKEITAEIERSQVAAATGGGLLFALVDVAIESSRANKAEELLQPIKNSLIDINFNQMFVEKLKTELANLEWLNVNKIVLINDLVPNQMQLNFEESDADAIMLINARYALSSNFSQLTANANASILPKNESLRQYSEKPTSKKARKSKLHIDNNIYRDSFVVSKTFAGALTDNEENAKILTAQSQLLKELFPKVADELAKNIVFSLQKTKAI